MNYKKSFCVFSIQGIALGIFIIGLDFIFISGIIIYGIS